jgi:pimeloyl-ACP methyl ester carboxylesterase
MEEEALLLGPHRSLVGIYTPADACEAGEKSELTFIFLNSGLIHRVGPERLYVKVARALATQGISSLRVDLSGIGDSSVRPDSCSQEELAVREPKEIMDDLEKRGDCNFILFGICAGAKYALKAAAEDMRVKAVVLVNLALSDEPDSNRSTQAQAQYYLRHSFWNPRAWVNLFVGKVNYKRLLKTIGIQIRNKVIKRSQSNQTLGDIIRAEFEPALAKNISMLALLSDQHAQYAQLVGDSLQDLQQEGQLQVKTRAETDHLFTPLADQEWLIEQVSNWARNVNLLGSDCH